MTVDLLLDRLERFRRGLLMYRDWCNLNVPHPRNGSDVIPLGDLDALRDKLRQEFSLLDEYVAAFSQGRYQIHLDAQDEHDIYVQALSEKCEDWHIDIILRDLEYMQNDLQARPLQQTIVLHNEGKDRLVPSSQRSFGLLGHLGSSVTPHTSETLHAVFRTVGNIIEQQIEQSEEKEKLQTHLRAIVEHPQISDLLQFSPSRLL